MILVVDANIVLAALLKNSETRRLLMSWPFNLYAPENLVKEIRKYEQLILEKSGLSKSDFEVLFELVMGGIDIIEKEKYLHSLEEADVLLGNVDKDDVPYLALAMSLANDGIWTNNTRHFQKQDKIKVWTTGDLLDELNMTDLTEE